MAAGLLLDKTFGIVLAALGLAGLVMILAGKRLAPALGRVPPVPHHGYRSIQTSQHALTTSDILGRLGGGPTKYAKAGQHEF